MSAVLKIIAAIVGLVVLIVVAVAIYLFTVFDPNDYKQEIQQLVKEQTDFDLAIDGDLSLSLFPWLGISVNGVKIDTPRGELGSLDQAQIYAKTGPLFGGNLEVKGINLVGLSLKLTVDEDGNANWETPGSADSSEAPEPTEEQPNPAALPLAAFTVGEFSIENAEILYRDLQAGGYHQLSNFNFNTRDVNLSGGSFPLEGNMEYRSEAGGDALPISLSAQVSPQQEPVGATIDELLIKVASLSISGNVVATDLLSEVPGFNTNIRIESDNLRKLLSELGGDEIPTANPNVLGKLELTAAITGDTNNVAVKGLVLNLDDINLQGDIDIKNLADPFMQFNFQAGAINLDDYMPPTTEIPEEAEPMAAEVALLPLAVLRDINSTGKITIDQLLASGLAIDNILLETNARDGLIRLSKVEADIYEGKLNGDATIDARTDNPQISLNQTLANVNANPALKSLADIDSIFGNLNLELHATTSGNTSNATTANLNGTVDLVVSDGKLTGIDVERMVCLAIATVRQQKLETPAEANPVTNFQELNASMVITNGLLNSKALVFAIDKIRATGGGQLNLVSQEVDFRLKAEVLEPLEESACSINERYAGIQWPVRCVGSLEDEVSNLCGPDYDGLGEIAAKVIGQEAVNKVGEKLLRGLFGN